MESDDEVYMHRALALAERAWGDTAPNPMVGAVLVKNGRVIGEGFHTRDGAAHAEIECLRAATESPEGATMYVTLEPCSTRGRTGACCDAIANAKIACVKIGALDPNPAHAGRALKIFADSKIACEHGILEGECRALNFIFNYSIVNSRALLALKYAVSADGKIAERRGKSTRITGAEARADVMHWRRLFGAIGVGVGTLIADNPSLTARIDGEISCGARLIFDASLKLADIDGLKNYNVFSDAFASRTRVVCDADASAEKIAKLDAQSICVMKIPVSKKSPAEFWDALKQALYSEKITSLYVEGGAGIISSVCAARAADWAFEYVAPSLKLGESALGAFDFTADKKCPFEIRGEVENLGADTIRRGEVRYL